MNHRKIPWSTFVAASDALYAQTYWRSSQNGEVHGGTPSSAYSKGTRVWNEIAANKPIIAIAGELEQLHLEEIFKFDELVRGKQDFAHFYSNADELKPDLLEAICAL